MITKKRHSKVIVKIAIGVFIIVTVVSGSLVYHSWRTAISPVSWTGPYLSVTVEKENGNWSILIYGLTRDIEGFQYYSFIIKRGNLTLVSFTMNDKQPTDPTNITMIDPFTHNLTNYDMYTLNKEGYTIYFYDLQDIYSVHGGNLIAGRGNLSGGDRFYIVNNGLRSGDVFEILFYDIEDKYTFVMGVGDLP